jgi:hypothetical protein
MTKAAKKALKSVGVPAVRWSDAYRQYFTRVGYRESSSGKRQRAFFYLGKDEKAAVAKAAALKSEWRDLRRKGGSLATWPTKATAPKAIAPSRPMERLSPQEIDAAIEQYHAEQTADAIEQGPIETYSRDGATGRVERVGRDAAPEQTPTLRLEQVRELYDAYRKAKVGIGGGQGLKQSTYSNDSRNLKLAFGFIDGKSLVNHMSYAEIEKWKDAVFARADRKDGITRRTAVNYMRAVKGMLDWAHTRPEIPYRHPEDFGRLFRFKGFTPVKVAAYSKDVMTKLLAKATDRERLYVYLALNCGHTQVDIGMLMQSEIQVRDGKRVIVRRRDKTSHQNDFESLHVLWDETWRLLQTQAAGPNQWGRALLNEVGKPLYRFDGKGKYNGVNHAYYDLLHRAEVELPFKQFRKMGATAIQRIGGDEARRLYEAGTIDSGDKVYVIDAWEKLTPHLTAWADELRRDGVLF